MTLSLSIRTLVVSSFLTLSVFANSLTEAQDLYARRGENFEFAKDSAVMYEALAAQATDVMEKAKLMNEAARGYYYVGTHVETNRQMKVWHEKGYEIAEDASELVENYRDNTEMRTVYAETLYWYGANLGKWGEANGIASSLGKWPKLRRTMEKIIDIGEKAAVQYGANRILGRAYYKLPAPLGNKRTAFNYLNEAFQNTKEGGEISTMGINNLYLAELLISVNRKDSARGLLEKFIAVDAQTFNPERIPETLEEQEEAREILRRL